MQYKPVAGQTWLINPNCKKSSAKFFYIVLPSKKNPRPVDKGRVTGFFLDFLKSTDFHDPESHFENELVFLKSPIYRLSFKDLQKEIFLKPFYFFLRDHLQKQQNSNNQNNQNKESENNVWEEPLPLPIPENKSKNPQGLDICEILPSEENVLTPKYFEYTLRFMLDKKKTKLVHLDQAVDIGKRVNISSSQNFFERFLKASAYDERKEGDNDQIFKINRHGIKTSDLLLKFNEFINPTCICSGKGFSDQDELEICKCGRIYHPACKKKPGFQCQKCGLEKRGLVTLKKRDDSSFRLDNLDYSKEIRKYREEFGEIQKSRIILKSQKELKNLKKFTQKGSRGKGTKNIIEVDIKKQDKKNDLLSIKKGSNKLKTLTIDQKIMRTFELWNVDHFSIGRIKLKEKKREKMKSLLMKGLSLGICEIMEDLKKYHKYLKINGQKSSQLKKKKLISYFKNMEMNQKNFFLFLKNTYESGIFQKLKDSGEIGIIKYLDNFVCNLENNLAKKNLRLSPRKYDLYIKKGRLLGLNLNQDHSKFLRFKILSKQLTYIEICSLGEEDLISEELQKKIEESKKEFWKERELNREAKYIIKNHKGDIEMEYIGDDKKRLGTSGFTPEHSIDSYHFSLDENKKEENEKKKLNESMDCIEIQMVDYQSKLKEKLKKSELIFFDIFKENTNEIKLKKQPILEIQKKKSNDESIKPNFIMKKNGNFINKKNVNLIRGVFDEADISPSRYYDKNKNRLKLNSSKSSYNQKYRKMKKKKRHTPDRIKERMMKRISKTLKPETVENLKGLINQVMDTK